MQKWSGLHGSSNDEVLTSRLADARYQGYNLSSDTIRSGELLTECRPQTVAVVERRSLTRNSLGKLLSEKMNHGAHRAGEAVDDVRILLFPTSEALRETLFEAREGKPALDLILLSLDDPNIDNGDLRSEIWSLQENFPATAVVVLADCESPRVVFDAFQCGIKGYLNNSICPDVVVRILRLILSGGTFIPESILLPVNDHVVPRLREEPSIRMSGVSSLKLTPKQAEVFRLLRKGYSNKVIGRELGTQEGTVKVHVRQIMRKLGATNRTHAVFLADQLTGGEV